MKKHDPIIIIDDDDEDISMIREAVLALGIKNEVLTFTDSRSALDHLSKADPIPFLILCDINMPKLDGFGLRTYINNNLPAIKSTPFIFLSTTGDADSITKGYSMNIQGFFTKPNSFNKMVVMIRQIVDYWNLVQYAL